MTDFTMSELESQCGELLPEKETLFLNHNWAGVYATNTSLALNAGTIGSVAMSGAWQGISINQG